MRDSDVTFYFLFTVTLLDSMLAPGDLGWEAYPPEGVGHSNVFLTCLSEMEPCTALLRIVDVKCAPPVPNSAGEPLLIVQERNVGTSTERTSVQKSFGSVLLEKDRFPQTESPIVVFRVLLHR